MLLEYPFFSWPKPTSTKRLASHDALPHCQSDGSLFKFISPVIDLATDPSWSFNFLNLIWANQKKRKNSCVETLKLKNFRILEYNRVVGSLVYCLCTSHFASKIQKSLSFVGVVASWNPSGVASRVPSMMMDEFEVAYEFDGRRCDLWISTGPFAVAETTAYP